MWHGSLRVSEVAATSAHSFCETSTLMGRDIQILDLPESPGDKYLLLTIKAAKASKGASALVELLPNKSPVCPVQAFFRVFGQDPPDPNRPIASLSPNLFIDPNLLNKYLKECFHGNLGTKEIILCHSLRMGLPTYMGSRGYPDEHVRLQGRWSSGVYLRYCREGRGLRLQDQFALFNRLYEDTN